MRLAAIVLLASIAPSLAAQDTDRDRFRDRLEGVPQLAMDRVELHADPALTFEGISAVSIDAQSNVYVLDRPSAGDPVVVLDPGGRLLRSWGKDVFGIPHGIRVDPAGNVWTVDANTSSVYKFTPEGSLLLEIQIALPDSERRFCGATDITFAPDGHVLVADGYCNGRVLEFDAAGQQVREWGTRGTEPGQFVVVHSIAVGPRGRVYVADRENGRLQSFDREGRLLHTWTYARQLFSVAFSPAGELYICVSLGGEPEEAYLIKVDPDTGEMLGRLDGYGHELAFSPDGTLWPASSTPELVLYRPRRKAAGSSPC